MDTICKFSIGQIIHHLRFDYRGVIVDVDADFQGSEEWYREMAKSKPPRDKPWYTCWSISRTPQLMWQNKTLKKNLLPNLSYIPL